MFLSYPRLHYLHYSTLIAIADLDGGFVDSHDTEICKHRIIGLVVLVLGLVWLVAVIRTMGENTDFSYQTGRMMVPGLAIIAGAYLLIIKGSPR